MNIFYFDVETTGLDAKANAIIQLAYIVSVDGKEVEEGNLFIQPFPNDVICQDALAVNRRTRDEIFMYPFMTPNTACSKLLDTLNKYVDNPKNKLYPAGYNVGFDCDFLNNFFGKNGNRNYAQYFNHLKIDPSCVLLMHDDTHHLENYRLATVCKHFDIPINPHDAVSDIRATKQLIEILKNRR